MLLHSIRNTVVTKKHLAPVLKGLPVDWGRREIKRQLGRSVEEVEDMWILQEHTQGHFTEAGSRGGERVITRAMERVFHMETCGENVSS